MATSQSYSSTIFTPQPTIIPPSAGDLEEARIKRLTDLANLTNIQQQPALEARRLALQKAGLDETAFYHQGQLKSDIRGQDVTQRGQDVQVRGQDLDVKANEARDATTRRGQDFDQQAHKDAQANDFIRTAFSRPDIPANVLSQAAANAGHPELANAFDTTHGHETEAKGQKAVSELSAVKSTLSPQDYAQVVASQASDPDVKAYIQKSAPHLLGTGSPTAPGVAAPAPVTDAPGYIQGAGAAGAIKNLPIDTANLGAGIYNNVVLPPANLLGSVLGTPPLRRQKKITKYSDAFR